jgi:hypothetical protein
MRLPGAAGETHRRHPALIRAQEVHGTAQGSKARSCPYRCVTYNGTGSSRPFRFNERQRTDCCSVPAQRPVAG